MPELSETSPCAGNAALPQRVPQVLGLARWPSHPAEVYAVISEALRNLDLEPGPTIEERANPTEVRAIFAEQPAGTTPESWQAGM